jgi:peptidoglycan/LPS O-acetylase OafA/YrhL
VAERAETASAGGRVGAMPGLDGIRALAVLAVIGYHGALGWLSGGYYGVDAFLVLSGFLITTLLLAEWEATDRVSLVGFWVRRARRLLPALILMLSGVALVVGLSPGVLSTAHLEADAVASLLYVANWHLAAEHASYFSAYQGQSALLHTWTLAIEEQFYLVWPLLVLAVLSSRSPLARLLGDRKRRLGVLLGLSLSGAVASAVWMYHLVPAGTIDPSRAYYGTDTRAQGLLGGAALAIAVALWGPVRTGAGRRVLAGAGVAGAVMVAFMWSSVPENSWFAFHGGFAAVSVACGAVVVSAARAPGGPVGRGLSVPPLRYLGRISYGMYLWYWPVLLVMTGARVGLRGYPLLGVRLAVIVALASASYRWVETPLRRGALPGWRALVAAPLGAAAAAFSLLGAIAAAPAAAFASPVLSASSPVSQAPAEGSAIGTAGRARQPGSAPAAVVTVPDPSSGLEGSGVSEPAGVSGVGARPAAGPAGTGPSDFRDAGARAAAGPGGVAASVLRARPVRILLVGDSMAGSLGVGMAQVAAEYGAQIVNEGQAGCSISMSGQLKVLALQIDPGAPCQVNNPSALVTQMGAWVRSYDPDVVVYLARSEVLDQAVGSQWGHLGQSSFDQWVRSRFTAMEPVLASGGAKVVLMTTPYYDTGEEGNGDAWPEDDPGRVITDNSIIASVAAHTGASVINVNALVSPGGHYSAAVDGVSLRCRDGAHFTAAGGRWLAARVLPELVALGRSSNTPNAANRTNVLPSSVPSWWPKLPCAS